MGEPPFDARCRREHVAARVIPIRASVRSGSHRIGVIVSVITHVRVGPQSARLEHMGTACSTYVPSDARADGPRATGLPALCRLRRRCSSKVRHAGSPPVVPEERRRLIVAMLAERGSVSVATRRARLRDLLDDRAARPRDPRRGGPAAPHARRRGAPRARRPRGLVPQPARAGGRARSGASRARSRPARSRARRSSSTPRRRATSRSSSCSSWASTRRCSPTRCR